jgi:methionyl-tRNA formyltransferase
MNIAVLGSGAECDAAIDSLQAAGHTVTHCGPSAREGIAQIANHHDAIAQGATDILLVSYGPLIEPAALAQARFYNVHNALLPRFRGFHGLVWSIINGEPEVGYTLHRVDAGIDSGPVHHQHRTPLAITDDIAAVRARLVAAQRADLGAAFTRIAQGEQPRAQRDADAIVVARRRPEDGRIDWRWDALRVYNLVRAIAPPVYGGAFTTWRGQPLVVRRATLLPNPPFIATPGRVVNMVNDAVWVMCGDRLLQLDELEYDGRVGAARSFFTRVGARLGD